MSNFRFVKPKLFNNHAVQWADWIEHGEYWIQEFELVPVSKLSHDEWKRAKTEDLHKKVKSGIPLDPVRLSLVDGKYGIDDGNHRIALSKELGYTHVPAIVIKGISTKPDFPPPPELKKEMLGRECLMFVQTLRNDAYDFELSGEVRFSYGKVQDDGYDIDVRIEKEDTPYAREMKIEVTERAEGVRDVVLRDGDILFTMVYRNTDEERRKIVKKVLERIKSLV